MGIIKLIKNEIHLTFERDPAARSKAQIFFLYPGVKAIIYHRIAHKLYGMGRYFLADWVSMHARKVTGIEIHPPLKLARMCLLTMV